MVWLAAVWLPFALLAGAAAGADQAGASAGGLVHVLPDGREVPMPEIASLDCDGMKSALREIDRSGYRGTKPLPKGDPNMPLFDYENRLTAAYFEQCSGGTTIPADPSRTFSDGFKTK